MRCFVAIRLPERVGQELGRHIRFLADTGAAVRWVKKENLHVTLKFLGEMQDDEVRRVQLALSKVSWPAMSLSVRGLGRFPPRGRPRVVWAGLEGDVDTLRDLARDIEERLAPLGHPPEQRTFQAHLTIGRVKGLRQIGALMLAIERRGQQLATSAFRVDAFALYCSERRSDGPHYYEISTYALAEPGA